MTTMESLIQELWFLKRDIVSDDYDRALNRLAQETPMIIHEYPTGEPCWTWHVPEKWTCHEAYLETMDKRRLIDYADHPLHVVSYSLPFEGSISLDELKKHLHTHPFLTDAIPFVFKYYDRDWGLCLSQKSLETLTDPEYRVVIRTTFDPGSLKVGEIFIPGESSKTFVIVAHLCHPAMVNDDLAGVVVLIDLAQKLQAKHDLHYSYRLLILPETIGSIAYLSHNEHLIPDMVGGLFLEMLGNDSPHALQTSYQPNSQVDRCMLTAFKSLDTDGYIGPYRKVIPNDERQFNAPGVRVPMLSISRVEKPSFPPRPYPEYHSSLDTPAIVSQQRLEASSHLVMKLIEAWEQNCYVVNKFMGEIFLSGFGIWIDYLSNPEGSLHLFEIMERCDGEHTVADIAMELDISFDVVWDVISCFEQKGLVSFSRFLQSTNPRNI